MCAARARPKFPFGGFELLQIYLIDRNVYVLKNRENNTKSLHPTVWYNAVSMCTSVCQFLSSEFHNKLIHLVTGRDDETAKHKSNSRLTVLRWTARSSGRDSAAFRAFKKMFLQTFLNINQGFKK